MSRSFRHLQRVLTGGVITATALGVALVPNSVAIAAPATTKSVVGAGIKSVSTLSGKRAEMQGSRFIRNTARNSVPSAASRLAHDVGPLLHAADDPAPPATTTPTLGTLGDSGVVTITATSAAAYVLFEVDGGPVDGQDAPTPVPVSAGTASATYTTWGIANGAGRSVTAADCSTTDIASCNTVGATDGFVVENDAPVITAPRNGASITGGFTVTVTSAGGGIRFLIDGGRKAFDSTSPYSFSYTGSALSSGHHTVSAVQCSVDESSCDGPEASIGITSNSLHPSLSAAAPAVFSPNGDRVKDTTSVTYSLPDRETATIAVLTTGGTVVRTAAFGTQSGKHIWTWNGRTTSGRTAPSGRYTVRLSTSAVRNGATVHGLMSRPVTVDLTAPSVTGLKYASSIYPHHDGYRDTFPVVFKTNEATTATLAILNSKHKTVRTIAATHAAGSMTLVWNGYDSHKHLVPAGTYSWNLTWHDGVGNKAHSATRHVTVSLRALVTKTATITENGDSFWTAGGSDTDCADASTSLSQYTHGVWLENVCDYESDDVQLASAFYHVTLPSAVSYSSVSVTVGGFSLEPPSTMLVAYGKNGGTSDYAIGHRYVITNDSEGYWHIGGVNPTGLMTSKHVMNVAVSVDDIDGTGDFDIANVKFKVTYKVFK